MSFEKQNQGEEEKENPENSGVKHYVTIALSTALIAGLSLYATQNLDTAARYIFTIFTALASVLYLYRLKTPRRKIADALYISSIILLLTPLILYIPKLGSEQSLFGETPQPADLALNTSSIMEITDLTPQAIIDGEITSIISLVAWITLFLLISLIPMTIGYILGNKTNKNQTD